MIEYHNVLGFVLLQSTLLLMNQTDHHGGGWVLQTAYRPPMQNPPCKSVYYVWCLQSHGKMRVSLEPHRYRHGNLALSADFPKKTSSAGNPHYQSIQRSQHICEHFQTEQLIFRPCAHSFCHEFAVKNGWSLQHCEKWCKMNTRAQFWAMSMNIAVVLYVPMSNV